MAGRRAIWWVCGWSSVQDLLWKIRSLIVLHSTNTATQNIIQREKKKLLFIMNNFLVISHLSEEACWFIYKQNTHVSSLISLWLSPLTFSKQLSPHRSRPLKQSGVEMWMSHCLLLPSEVSFSLNTHTLVTPRSACNISGGTWHGIRVPGGKCHLTLWTEKMERFAGEESRLNRLVSFWGKPIA